jgi:hypothetical protein
MTSGWAKVPEASRYAGLKARAFRALLKKGLKYSKLPSGTILVKLSDVDEFLERFRVGENQVDRIADEAIRELSGGKNGNKD